MRMKVNVSIGSNPEQIFNIIDMKVVDEYGLQTGKRKVDPQEWNEYYHKLIHQIRRKYKQDILAYLKYPTSFPRWVFS